jgi:aryl-alcohol dehydrogenase-like predicted oxidoreductase
MSYRTLGQSGLQVTLTLGTMMFGEQTSTEDSLRIIDKAWDQGINFIDTADVYTGGRSEEIVGEAIARQRQEWVLASKVGLARWTAAEPQRPEPQTHLQRTRSQPDAVWAPTTSTSITCTAKTTTRRWKSRCRPSAT